MPDVGPARLKLIGDLLDHLLSHKNLKWGFPNQIFSER